jgi:hypothetical protein
MPRRFRINIGIGSKHSCIKFAFLIIAILIVSSVFISFFKRYKINLKYNESGANFSEEIVFDDIRVHINKDSFSHDSLRGKTRSDEMVEYLKKNLKKGDTVISISHNIGVRTLLMAKLVRQSGRIYFYNPSQKYVDSMKSSALANGFECRIFAHALGMSDRDFDGLLVYKNNFPDLSGKIESRDHEIPVGYSAMTIKVSSIDGQLPHLQNVDLIVIDVNDDCSKIINGAINLIKKSGRLSIMISQDDASANSAVFDILSKIGFGVSVIQADGSLRTSSKDEIKKLGRCFLLFRRS